MPDVTTPTTGGPQGPQDAPRQTDVPRSLLALDQIPTEVWDHVSAFLVPYLEGVEEGWNAAARDQQTPMTPLPMSRSDLEAATHKAGFMDGITRYHAAQDLVRKQLEAVVELLDREGIESPLCAFDDPAYLVRRVRLLLMQRDPRKPIRYLPPPKPKGAEGILLVDMPPEKAFAAARRADEMRARAAACHLKDEEELSHLNKGGKDELLGRMRLKRNLVGISARELAGVLGLPRHKVEQWDSGYRRPVTVEEVGRITTWLQRGY